MRNTFPLGALGIFSIVCLFVGCVALQPGADPLVVRVEQAETLAKASFDFVVTTDDSNRAYWITNSPAFHNFAEWLREGVQCDAGKELPRGICMIQQVDTAKLAYLADKSQSNALLTVFGVLTDAQAQAAAWKTIATGK